MGLKNIKTTKSEKRAKKDANSLKKKPKILIKKKSLSVRQILYKQFLGSDYWKLVRSKVLERDEYSCCLCSSKVKLDIHHKTYVHHKNELNHLGDLITLCRKCHKKQHSV